MRSGVGVSPVRTLIAIPVPRRIPAQGAPVRGLAGVEDPGVERPGSRVGAHPQPVHRELRAAGGEVAGERAHLGGAEVGGVCRDRGRVAVHVVADLRRVPLDPVEVRRAGVTPEIVVVGAVLPLVLASTWLFGAGAEHRPVRNVLTSTPKPTCWKAAAPKVATRSSEWPAPKGRRSRQSRRGRGACRPRPWTLPDCRSGEDRRARCSSPTRRGASCLRTPGPRWASGSPRRCRSPRRRCRRPACRR